MAVTDFVTSGRAAISRRRPSSLTSTLGLHRSVYMPERGFSEFETLPFTLSVVHAEAIGTNHHVNHNPVALHVDDVPVARATLEALGVEFHGDVISTRPHGVLQGL